MATLKDSSALDALNENEYINKLYDADRNRQQQMLQDNLAKNTGALDAQKQDVQQQTTEYLNRTDVESSKATGDYSGGPGQKISAGADAQAALTQSITRKNNEAQLKDQQNQADVEIERQRALLGSQYAAAIKQAQADNDMERAQQLYEAAKAEDAQLLALKREAAALMAAKGDKSIYDSLLQTDSTATAPREGSDAPTWGEVLRNEGSINQIYDAQKESERQGMLLDYLKAVSDLEAQRLQSQRQTDAALNSTYVDALKRARNYAETQTAYGQGSGTAAQARLEHDMQLQRDLTKLRGLQLASNAELGMRGANLGAAYRDSIAQSDSAIEQKRIAALIQAAENEEATLLENQSVAGNQYAKGNDYSILGKLYGLTQDQINRLQGTGAYAPRRVIVAPAPLEKGDTPKLSSGGINVNRYW